MPHKLKAMVQQVVRIYIYTIDVIIYIICGVCVYMCVCVVLLFRSFCLYHPLAV